MPKPTVLLVDYDPKRIQATSRPFEAAGWAVEVARDGVAGVDAFGRVRPDVVFVEMMLPKRHGFEVCQELRRMRPGRKTAVYILGTTHAERYRLQALGAGANDYLARPVSDERLLELCRNALAEPNQDLPANPPDADAPGAEPPSADEVEDFLASLDEDTDRPAADPAPAPPAETVSKVVPPVELGDLTDDEIAARLDEIMPSIPIAAKGPEPAPEPTPMQVEAAPEASVSATADEDVEVKAEAPPEIESPRPAPKVEPAIPAKPEARTPRPAPVAPPRATLPQSAPASDRAFPSARPARSPAFSIAAVIGAVALAIVGLFAWRAMTGEDEATAAGSIVAQDFARPSSPARQDPAPFEAETRAPALDRETVGATGSPTTAESAPAPVPVAPPPAANAREPRPEPVRPTAPPVAEIPRPTPAPTPQPTRVPEAVAIPVVPPAAEPPMATSPSRATPVEEPLGLPSSIATVATDPIVEPKPQPAPAPARTTRGSLLDLSEVDFAPVATSRPAPSYPPLALRMRREGKVTVRLLVDETGKVADAQVAAGSSEFNSEALKAARQWTYQPATKGGVPVKVWVTEVIGFKL